MLRLDCVRKPKLDQPKLVYVFNVGTKVVTLHLYTPPCSCHLVEGDTERKDRWFLFPPLFSQSLILNFPLLLLLLRKVKDRG